MLNVLLHLAHVDDLWYDKYNKSYYEGAMFMKDRQNRYAWVATVGAKGQIVIPKEAREVFDIHPGDVLLLLGDTEQGIAIPTKGRFEDLFNLVYGGKRDELDRFFLHPRLGAHQPDAGGGEGPCGTGP